MDTEATRPRARIGFMRRRMSSSSAVVEIDPSRAVGPVDPATSMPSLEPLRDRATKLRQRVGAKKSRREEAGLLSDPEPAQEADQPVVPQSMVERDAAPTDSWLKRLFATSRIARYRQLKRSRQLGRHEDVSV
jgi:hypothetical protein